HSRSSQTLSGHSLHPHRRDAIHRSLSDAVHTPPLPDQSRSSPPLIRHSFHPDRPPESNFKPVRRKPPPATRTPPPHPPFLPPPPAPSLSPLPPVRAPPPAAAGPESVFPPAHSASFPPYSARRNGA